MSRWDNLTMAQKAELMGIAVRHGVTGLEEIKNMYDGGGLINGGTLPEVVVTGVDKSHTPQTIARNKSRKGVPNKNFMNAKDMPWYSRGVATYFPWIANPKTCINTVTGFYDPNNTVASNVQFTDYPEKYNYKEINQKDAVPGDIIILSDKDGWPHHAVMFDSVSERKGKTFDNFPIEIGDTLVNYSNGGRNPEDYRVQQPLSKFLGPNAGGDFTGNNRYFRYTGK